MNYSKEELEKMYPSINVKRLSLAISICLIILLVIKEFCG